MAHLKTVEIKAFIPAQNFSTSKNFYQDLGFTKASDSDGIAYFYYEHCSFLLREICEGESISDWMMHLLVEDIQAWHNHVLASGIEEKYRTEISEVKEQPWKMLDFTFNDPSGVQWCIGQNI